MGSDDAARRPRVLLTGFEPFAGADTNPSWVAVRLLGERGVPGVELHVLRLPVVYGQAGDALVAAVDDLSPDVVVATGLAGGPAHIRLERVALNLDDARIPDNAGRSPVDESIVPGGPTAYLTTLPVKAALEALRAVGLPAVVSNTAGTFVCNHVAYRLAHHLASGAAPGTRGGFVHVPQAGDEGLATTAVADALALVIGAALTHERDVAVAAGALD